MRFQRRDGEIIGTIYESDGVLARRHIKELFWPNKTERAMEQRLAKLERADYISWPSRDQRKNHPIPEPICWLGWRGALTVAGFYGIKVDPPKSDNEYQLRSLQKILRDAGIRWVREPRWIQLAHDMRVIDFKLAIDGSLVAFPNLNLEQWIPEGSFRSDMDVISYKSRDGTGKLKDVEKGICPDGFFEIIDEERLKRGELHRARFLLEIDMATHDNPSFGRDKVRPGIEYIRSFAYKKRFGANEGFWLVVTKGQEKRITNLIKQIHKHALEDSQFFFITSFEQIYDANLLADPIWWQAGIDHPVPLLE